MTNGMVQGGLGVAWRVSTEQPRQDKACVARPAWEKPVQAAGGASRHALEKSHGGCADAEEGGLLPGTWVSTLGQVCDLPRVSEWPCGSEHASRAPGDRGKGSEDPEGADLGPPLPPARARSLLPFSRLWPCKASLVRSPRGAVGLPFYQEVLTCREGQA